MEIKYHKCNESFFLSQLVCRCKRVLILFHNTTYDHVALFVTIWQTNDHPSCITSPVDILAMYHL